MAAPHHEDVSCSSEVHALAVFHDHGGGVLRPFLRPGFRHCFVALAAGDYWIAIDGRRGLPSIQVVAAASFDLAAFYRGLGYTVAPMREAPRPARTPLAIATCVGAAKRVLGIRAPLALTPYRLWKCLERNDARSPFDTALPMARPTQGRPFDTPVASRRATQGQREKLSVRPE